MDLVIGKPSNWAHPAIRLANPISSGIFPALYDWIFEHPVFQRWSQESVNWNLHCVGDPGGGKTTLAAIIARHLKRQFRNPVVTLFADGDKIVNDVDFFEDFLHAVYHGFREWSHASDDHSDNDYQVYARERFTDMEGSRTNRRLSLIRTALYKLLRAPKEGSRAFLILDGLDLLSGPLRLLIENELASIRSTGVNILVTTRVAVFEKFVNRCDHIKHGDPDEDDEPLDEFDRERLDMFYTCEGCLSILCLPCRAAGRTCDREECESKGPMRELYEHVNITVSISSQDMEDYICWTLEREHGDIGLHSPARKPPLSSLGLSIRKNKNPRLAQEIVSEIQRLADGHVGICKARLDFVNELQSVEEWQQRRYQLPSNIVSMLNAAVQAVEKQSSLQQHLGLQSIAAAGRADWPEGIEIPLLRQLLKDCGGQEVRSGEDILRAARGLLHAPVGDEIQSIIPFNETFHEYVFHDYNEKVFEAGQKLPYAVESDVSDVSEVKRDTVRFEPQTITEEPGEITPFKLHRSVTTVESNHDAIIPRYIVRQGTRAWK